MSNEEQLSTKVAVQAKSIEYIMEQFKTTQEENQKQHGAIIKSQLEFHKETRQTLENIMEKLDGALAEKADKKQVNDLMAEVEDLKSWKIKLIAIGSVVLFIITFLKTQIINFIGKL